MVARVKIFFTDFPNLKMYNFFLKSNDLNDICLIQFIIKISFKGVQRHDFIFFVNYCKNLINISRFKYLAFIVLSQCELLNINVIILQFSAIFV